MRGALRLEFFLPLVLWVTPGRADTRAVTEWLGALRSTERAVWVAAAYQPPATAAGDHAAIALLVSALKDGNANVRKYAASALGEFGFEPGATAGRIAALLDDKDFDVRAHAAAALAKLGSVGAEAAADILVRPGKTIKVIKTPKGGGKLDWERFEFPVVTGEDYAEKVLRQLGVAALPAVLRVLRDAVQSDSRTRAKSIIRGIPFGDGIKDVFAVLVNGQAAGKAAALEALDAWGEKTGDFLKEQLSDPGKRTAAMLGLAQVAPAGTAIGVEVSESDISTLAGMLRDRGTPAALRRDAAWLLGIRSPEACAGLQEVADSVKEDAGLRTAAVFGLPAACEAPAGIPTVERVLQSNPSGELGSAAIRALGGFGAAASSGVPLLAKVLGKDATGQVSATAATALSQIGGQAALQIVAPLATGCGTKTDRMYYSDCRTVLEAVARFGEPGLDILAERTARDSTTAALVLKKSGEKGVAKLNEAFRRADPARKAELATVVAPADDLVPELERTLRAESDRVRRGSLAEALVGLSPQKTLDVFPWLARPSYTAVAAAEKQLGALPEPERTHRVLSYLRDSAGSVALKRLAIGAARQLAEPGAVAEDLARLATDEKQDAELRASALRALADMHGTAALSWTWLADAAGSKTQAWELRSAAILALTAEAERQPAAALALLRVFSSTDVPEYGSVAGLGALSKLEGLRQEYRDTLISVASDKQRSPFQRAAVVAHYEEFLPDAETLVPILRGMVSEAVERTKRDSRGVSSDRSWEYEAMGVAALEALGKFGRAAAPAVPELHAIALRTDLPSGFEAPLAHAMKALGAAELSAMPDTERAVRANPTYLRLTIGQLAGSEPGKATLRRLLATGTDAIKETICLELGRLGPPSQWAEREILNALGSNSAEVRRAAAGALLEIDSGANAGPELAAELNAEYIRDEWYATVRRATDYADGMLLFRSDAVSFNYTGLFASAGGRLYSRMGGVDINSSKSLPELWERPPLASARDDIGALIAPHAKTLGEAHRLLREVLRATGFDEVATYQAPGGFTLITKVERIHDDGTSFEGKERWTNDKTPLRSISLAEYLRRLFLEKPGQFRLMAFIVSTGVEMTDNTKNLTEQFARSAVLRGARGDLPEDLAAQPLAGRHCEALIYHFAKRAGGGVRVLLPSELSATAHLTKSLLLARLGEVK